MRLAAAITLCIGVLLAALFRYGSAPEQPPVAGAENERPASSDLQAPELAYARVLIDPPSAPTEPTEPGDVTADKPGWYSHQDPIERLQTILGIYHEKRASGDPARS